MNEDTSFNIDEIIDEAKKESLAPDITEPLPTEQDLLDSLLCEIEQQQIDELGLSFVNPVTGISNDQQADFFIRRYKKLKETTQSINDTADAQITSYKEKVDSWRENELSSIHAQMEYVTSVLESYAKGRLAGAKKRSIKMIEGTLSFTRQQPKFDYDDKKLREFFSHIKDGSQYLEPQDPKIKWGEFKKACKVDDDGIFRYNTETVPGVVVTTRPDKFSVK